jgi:diaminopimelate epimerase
VELGLASPEGFSIETDSGLISARISGDLPEIDLQPVTRAAADYPPITRASGEHRIGFAVVGVPHLVVLSSNVADAPVAERGRVLRNHPSLADGANVNFVSPGVGGAWLVRTYERGVEAETLACGSGAVATAILLVSWGLAKPPVELETASGRRLRVRLTQAEDQWLGSLQGEAKLVFTGQLGEL